MAAWNWEQSGTSCRSRAGRPWRYIGKGWCRILAQAQQCMTLREATGGHARRCPCGLVAVHATCTVWSPTLRGTRRLPLPPGLACCCWQSDNDITLKQAQNSSLRTNQYQFSRQEPKTNKNCKKEKKNGLENNIPRLLDRWFLVPSYEYIRPSRGRESRIRFRLTKSRSTPYPPRHLFRMHVRAFHRQGRAEAATGVNGRNR